MISRRFVVAVAASFATALAAAPALADTIIVAPGPRRCFSFRMRGPCTRYPRVAFDIEGGFSSFTEGGPFGFRNGVGSATSTGPSWGARLGVDFLPWLAIDAHYLGIYNPAGAGVTRDGSVGLLTSAAIAELRLTVPTRFVQPYGFTGIGEYNMSLVGGADARNDSVLHGHAQPGVPFGIGLGIPINRVLSAGFEVSYNFQIGEVFSKVDSIGGGDPVVANGVLRWRY
jgi:hypothetical protein